MAVEILFDEEAERACYFCNTDEVAFGPVFRGVDAAAKAMDVLRYLRAREIDPREADWDDVLHRYEEFLELLSLHALRFDCLLDQHLAIWVRSVEDEIESKLDGGLPRA